MARAARLCAKIKYLLGRTEIGMGSLIVDREHSERRRCTRRMILMGALYGLSPALRICSSLCEGLCRSGEAWAALGAENYVTLRCVIRL